jgi:hypothetical protein
LSSKDTFNQEQGMSFDAVERGAGPPLLLIHGTGATSDFYDDFPEPWKAATRRNARGNHAMHLDNAAAWSDAAAGEAFALT